MSSPSAQRGAATRAPPPPDQLASFYRLVDKKVIAGMLCREARDVELSGQAAVQAEALFGDDSLVVANMRYSECCSLNNLNLRASGAEKEALLRQSWRLLVSVIILLLRRLEADTLLPGTIREEELDYDAYVIAAIKKATNEPAPSPAVLRAGASTLGYKTLLSAVFRSLDLLPFPYWPQNERTMVESFVLRGLDVIPRTAGAPSHLIAGEDDLAAFIEQHLSPERNGPAFCDAMLRKWRSDAVSNVLRARGVLQTGIAAREQSVAEFDAAARRRREARAARLRPPLLLQDGEDGQGVRGVLRLSLRGVLLPGTPSAGLEGAQKGVSRDGGGAAGCGRRSGRGSCGVVISER